MIAEEFSSGNSPLHNLDPRVKIVVATLFAVIVAIKNELNFLLLALLFSLSLLIIARLNFKKVTQRLLIVNLFILLLWLFLPFTSPGDTIFSLGPLLASREGIHHALLITIKSNCIILAVVALLSTSTIIALVHALRHLYVPDKLVQLLFFCYRYIQVIHLEYLKMTTAMKIRGFKPKTDLHTYKTYAYLIGMLLVRSFDRSRRVYHAMICRGFKGEYWMADHFVLKKSDIFLATLMLSIIFGLIFLQWIPSIPF